jgi:hypothetical protein
MATTDVKELLDLAVERTGIQEIAVRHRPLLLSDNGPAYVSEELKNYLATQGNDPDTRCTVSSDDTRKDRAVSPIDEERDQSAEVLPTVGTGAGDRTVRELLQQPAVSRILE